MPPDQFHHDRRSSHDSSSSESSSPWLTETSNKTPSNSSTSSTTSPPSSSPSLTPQPNPPPPTPSKKRKFHPDFKPTLNFMSSPLTPFVNNETGQPHPEFPKTHLAFHLLTSNQLDTLARHYHQVYPAQPATLSYPFQIRSWVGIPDESYVDIATKRRRFGYFIGMPGFTDPVNSGLPEPVESEGGLDDVFFFGSDWEGCECNEDDDEGDSDMCEDGSGTFATEEEVLEWSAREWEAALRKAGDKSDGPFRKY